MLENNHIILRKMFETNIISLIYYFHFLLKKKKKANHQFFRQLEYVTTNKIADDWGHVIMSFSLTAYISTYIWASEKIWE